MAHRCAYQVINFFCFFFNCFGKVLRLLPSAPSTFSHFLPGHSGNRPACASSPMLALSMSLVTSSTPLAGSPTAWPSSWVLNQPQLDLRLSGLCYPSCRGSPQPEKNIPIAIMTTVGIGFVTSWTYCISMFFGIKDLDSLVNTTTGVPILELSLPSLGQQGRSHRPRDFADCHRAWLQMACNTWQSRLCWAFARDRGMPGHKWLSQVNHTLARAPGSAFCQLLYRWRSGPAVPRFHYCFQ